MKKDEIALIRLMSVAVLLFLQSLILVFALGGDFFSRIVNRCNSNVYDLDSVKGSAYNIFYYEGLDLMYVILFSIATILVISSCVGILLKINQSGKSAFVGSAFSLVVGVYVLFAKIGEKSSSIRYVFVKLVADEVNKSDIQTCSMIGARFLWAVLLVVLAILTLLIVKSSGVLKLKMYNKKNVAGIWNYITPVLYGTLFLDLFRRNFIISRKVGSLNSMQQSALMIIDDYYINNRFFFSWTWLYMLGLGLILGLILKKRLNNKLNIAISVGIPTLITTLASLIYFMNPPKLFGVITVDFDLCDVVEKAFGTYLIVFCVAVFMINLFNYYVVNEKLNDIEATVTVLANAVISVIIIMLFANNLNRAYWACIATDILTVIIMIVLSQFKIKKINSKA